VVRFVWVYWLGTGGEGERCIVDGHVGPRGEGTGLYSMCGVRKGGVAGFDWNFLRCGFPWCLPIRVYNAMETNIAPERAESLSPLEI
jgi:hypothetical protein